MMRSTLLSCTVLLLLSAPDASVSEQMITGVETVNWPPFIEHLLKPEQLTADAIMAYGLLDEGYLDTAMSGLQTGLANISKQCVNDTTKLLQDLTNLTEYSLYVLDSIGKPPSGILSGNILWMGNYDECLAIEGKFNEFPSRYCYVNIAFTNSALASIAPVIGLCVPKSCNKFDVSEFLKFLIDQYHINIDIKSTECPSQPGLSSGDIAMIVVCGLIASLVLIGTSVDIYQQFLKPKDADLAAFEKKLYEDSRLNIHDVGHGHVDEDDLAQLNLQTGDSSTDIIQQESGPEHTSAIDDLTKLMSKKKTSRTAGTLVAVLICFSWLTNGGKLFDTTNKAGNLAAVNGVRFLSMSWVILGHTYIFAITYVSNGVDAMKLVERFTFGAIANAFVAVDSFFFLSGMLVAYLTLKELHRTNGKLNWALFYFHRFWRLTPVYMFCMVFWFTLYPLMVAGPFAESFRNSTGVHNCFDKWWTNILYINNIYPKELADECMGWTWYLANDMQFFAITPVFIYLLYRSWRVGVVAVLALLVGCLGLTSGMARHYGVLPTVFSAAQDTVAQQEWQYIYIQPWYRISPYLVGLLVGFLVQATKGQVKLPKWAVAVGWACASATCLAIMYGLYPEYHNGAIMSKDVGAFYVGTFRCAWALGLGWTLFVCLSGYGGPVNWLLSFPIWGPLGRLTYCAYLVHPAIIYYRYMTIRQPIYSTDIEMIYLFLGNLAISYAVAVVVSLSVEAPFMQLEKILFKRGANKSN